MPPYLVLGATGGYGGAMVQELIKEDTNDVYAVSRKSITEIKNITNKPNLKFIKGDILNGIEEFIIKCDYIIFAVNVPYPEWSDTMPLALDNCIKLALHWDSMIIFAGNVYALKPVYNVRLNEDHPMAPVSKKGEIRNQLELKLKKSTLKVLIIRGNDYFGPTARNGLVDMLFKNAIHQKTIQCLGKDIIHEWVYLPDLARATIQLLASGKLKHFDCIHFKGFTELTRNQFATKVAETANELLKTNKKIKISSIPWFGLKIGSLFDPILKELLEMRYLFDNSLILDDKKLKTILPDFELTNIQVAIETTLESYKSDK